MAAGFEESNMYEEGHVDFMRFLLTKSFMEIFLRMFSANNEQPSSTPERRLS